MKSLLLALVLIALPVHADQIQTVCFTPGEDCRALIVAEIGKAKKSVRVQAYSFTCPQIAEAMTDAHKRGVDVQGIFDQSRLSESGNKVQEIYEKKVPVLIDARHTISHNKVIIIDGKTVITGSYNFTKAAQGKNAENVVVITDPAIAKKYLANWKEHAGHAEAFQKLP